MMLATDPGTLGGSRLASWTMLWCLLGAFAAVLVVLAVLGRPDDSWGGFRQLARIPRGLTRITKVPGWAATAIGLSLYGLLVAGQGFYDDVSWHIALGRDDSLFTAPHTGILVGLVCIFGSAALGTFVATMDRVEPALHVGNLRVPRALLPLWALGGAAVCGFPLDEIWHRNYGVDVTMWSPTHMLMILGATFTGLAGWLVLAQSGVRPTDGRWGRGLHCFCAWLTLQGLVAPQGEFTFGVPQFNQLFHPILICMAAGLALVVMRLVLGRGWTVGVVVVSWLLLSVGLLGGGADDSGSPVPTRFGGIYVVSALVVEVVAAVLGTQRRLRFALVSGLGIGTVGLAGEWLWNEGAYQRWTTNLLPEAVVLGVLAAVATAILGVAVARGFVGDADDDHARGRPVPAAVVAAAGLVALAVILFPMRRPTGDVTAAVHVVPGPTEGTAFVEATLTPADAADDAYWFQVSAWQGGGLALADMEPTGVPGVYRSEHEVPVDGHWKTLLRLHRGHEMMAIPVFLPGDPSIGKEEIPATDRTQAFEPEREYLLRETFAGNGWVSPLVHLGLLAAAAVWTAAFAAAVRRPRSPGDVGAPPVVGGLDLQGGVVDPVPVP